MYAVIQTGGKQFRVAEGDVVRVERLSRESLAKGAEVVLGEILAVGKDDGLHLIPHVDDLGGMLHLFRPCHLRNMDQTFHPFL